MEKFIRFSIYLLKSTDPSESEQRCKIDPLGVSERLFREALEIVKEFHLTRVSVDQIRNSLHIVTNLKNPGLSPLFRLLNKVNLRPDFWSEGKGFDVRITRQYSKEDLDKAELLYLPLSIGPLCDYVGRNGERWICQTGNFGFDSGLGWQQSYGSINQMNYFVSEEIRAKIEGMGLEGLKFTPLEWDNPQEAKRQYWEITSDRTMPPAEQAIETKDRKTFYVDGCYEPEEVVFDNQKVNAMQPFDFALSHEKVGWLEDEYRGNRLVIVSQKARWALESAGVEVDYNVIRFSDDMPEPDDFASIFGSDIEIA